MKKTLAGLMILTMILTCILLPSKAVYAADGAAEFQSSTTEVTVGETFEVSLVVSIGDEAPGVLAVHYGVEFTPGILQSNETQTPYVGVDNNGGAISITDDPQPAGTKINHYTRTLSFTALQAGDAVIRGNLVAPDDTYGFGFSETYNGHAFAVLPSPTITIHVKEKATEPPTEEPTEPPTEEPTEPQTEPQTEPVTEPVTEPATDAPTNPPASGNTNLSSLAVAPGEIQEAFLPTRTSYTVSDLDYSVKVLNVGATAEDPNAQIVIMGNANLKVGSNTVTIRVTAPDGTVKDYTLEVVRKNKNGGTVVTPPTEASTEAPTEKPTEVETTTDVEASTEEPTTDENETLPPTSEGVEVTNIYDGTGAMMIKSDWLEEAMPTGFTRSSVSYKGNDVAVAKSKKDLVLYYLESQDQKTKNFYVYNSDNDTFYPYYPVNPTGGVYVLLNTGAADVTEDLRQVTLRVNEDGPKINAWSLSGDVNDGVFLVYAMAEDGSVGWYRFDTTIGTFVRYFKDFAPETAPVEDPTEPSKAEDPDAAAQISKLKEDVENLQKKNREYALDYNNVQSKHSKLSLYFIILLVVLFIVLILAIILAWKLRSLYSRYDFSDDGDDGDDDGGDDDGGDDGNGGDGDKKETENTEDAKPQEKVILPKQAPFGVDTSSDSEKLPSQTVDESIKQTVAAAYAARQAEKEAKAKEAAQKAAAAKEAAAKEVAEKEAKAKEAAQKAAAAKKAADAAAEKAKAAGMKLNAVSDKKGLYDLDVNSVGEKADKTSGNDEANDDDFEFIEF